MGQDEKSGVEKLRERIDIKRNLRTLATHGVFAVEFRVGRSAICIRGRPDSVVALQVIVDPHLLGAEVRTRGLPSDLDQAAAVIEDWIMQHRV